MTFWPFKTSPTQEMVDDAVINPEAYMMHEIAKGDSHFFGGMWFSWDDPDDILATAADGSCTVSRALLESKTVPDEPVKRIEYIEAVPGCDALACVYCGVRVNDSERVTCLQCGAPLRRGHG